MVRESELVEAAVNGDADSFTELCRRYYPSMVAISHAVLGDAHLAEDAVQEAFAKACLKLPQLRKKDKFACWLAAICRNRAKDLAKCRAKQNSIENDSVRPANSNEDELKDAVREAINTLSAHERDVLFLRYYDGLAYERISDVLGISQSAIDGRLRRARKKVAGYLRRNGFIEV